MVSLIAGLVFENRDGRLAAINPGEREALCRVVETAWAYSPRLLLESLECHEGQGYEGVATYVFHREAPDEMKPGMVALYYFDREEIVDESAFRAFVLDFARAHLPLTLKVPDWLDSLPTAIQEILKLDRDDRSSVRNPG